MLNSYQQQLMDQKEKARELERLEREHNVLTKELRQLEETESFHRRKLEEEKVDVEKLESFSLVGVFTSIIGKKEEKLDKEKQEVVAAQLKWKEAKGAKATVEEEVTQLRKRISSLGNPKQAYEQLLLQKQDYLVNNNHEAGDRALKLLEDTANLKADVKEIKEALAAGNKASDALASASLSLDKAKNWGTLDMFGGGLLSTSMKHSNLDDANQEVHRAQSLLRKFAHELDDIGHTFKTDLSISGGLTFMDYFFDGLISDWLVQDKINNSAEQVDEMHRETNRTLNRLEQLLSEAEQTITQLELEWKRLVETAG